MGCLLWYWKVGNTLLVRTGLSTWTPALPGDPISEHGTSGIMPWAGAWVPNKKPLQGWCLECVSVSQYKEQPGGTLWSFLLNPVLSLVSAPM